MLKKQLFILLSCILVSGICIAQQIVFSDPLKEDVKDITFDIIGKMANNNIPILKNLRWKYGLNIYDDTMNLKNEVALDFLPSKTLNVDYVANTDHFYLIYQFQKKGIIYCMQSKFDSDGNMQGNAVELDTTKIETFGENKIYSVIKSDDKQKIMVFKIQKIDGNLNFLTLLYNNQMQLLKKSRLQIEYNSRYDVYNDFVLDNAGNLIFTGSKDENKKRNKTVLYLMCKPYDIDAFVTKKMILDSVVLDDVKLKVDNTNKQYLITSFYAAENGNNIDGIFSTIWSEQLDSLKAIAYNVLTDSIRSIAKNSGSNKSIFNDFEIRNIILKKDGSFVLTAEYYVSQNQGNNLIRNNRNDFWTVSPNAYYFNDPYAWGSIYNPNRNFNNMQQNIRYYYENILIINFTKNLDIAWGQVIAKQQTSDDNDIHLSYNTFNTTEGIHFIYNNISKRDKLLLDNIVSSTGMIKRSPSLKTFEKEYEFMPRFSKQISQRQVIIPVTLRNRLCFAKVYF